MQWTTPAAKHLQHPWDINKHSLEKFIAELIFSSIQKGGRKVCYQYFKDGD